ncbi:3-deoxy-D-manno-octulosonic acid transferase [Muriicola marianensis]|uniref:3-deoxy-D-manno-octulosonic acid transferase n=1 Tax=Muriicola marianensis TaxID=1324801 RepID=A0ABQ1QUH5_9FLAO|nr:glycosyltransferase N-terminal domain-containing protein [Muriicola marianensis]GGD46851.1 3-deoxy-D-manno-octulosonic acid transferase [Muriicola marianensis]
MYSLYNLLIYITWQFLKIAAYFSPKLTLFVKGRQEVFGYLKENIRKGERLIWVHTASLGEFEQGLPVIKALKSTYPQHKVLVTFFSPSGYEVKKNSREADLITYLPVDIRRNTRKFLELTRPEIALFVKYEIWPNYLKELNLREIPAVLISGRFTPDQVFFKGYGGFMRKALRKFSHYFVQDERSVQLLERLKINDVTLSGDTRFDRVSEILERDNTLRFMDDFKGKDLCFVLGSTWPEDEALLIPFLQDPPPGIKFLIAPHDIKEAHLSSLREKLPGNALFYTNMENQDPSRYDILVLDTIGLLTKVYSYADLAYVGGGFATGLHNTLEPAVFGIPVITGPKYQGFAEAEELVALGGITVVDSPDTFAAVVRDLLSNENTRERQGKINTDYVALRKGATRKIMEFLQNRMEF